MEGSKRTATRIGHLYSSTKNNTSNRFKFIMAPSCGKTCGLGRRNGTTTQLEKIKDCRQHALVTCAK